MRVFFTMLLLFSCTLFFSLARAQDEVKVCYQIDSKKSSDSTFCVRASEAELISAELFLEGKTYRLDKPHYEVDLMVDIQCNCLKYINIYSQGDKKFSLTTYTLDGETVKGDLSVEGFFAQKKRLMVTGKWD